MSDRLPALVLAGERPGGGVLARHFGTAAGALVPVAGRACIERVISVLRATPCLEGGLISGPAQEVVDGSNELAALFATGDFRWVEPMSGPAESAARALQQLDRWPVLMTTADHALLDRNTVETFIRDALSRPEDAVVGLAYFDRVREAFPHSRRTILAFADGGRCGTNLFLLRTPAAMRVVNFWQALQADRKRPLRMARRMGMVTLIRYVSGRLSASAALERIGRQAGCTIGWVNVAEPRAAVDVDSLDDHTLAERLLSSTP